jgi:hypothetical protein
MNVTLIIALLGGSLSIASAATERSFRAWLPAILLTAGFVANFLIS